MTLFPLDVVAPSNSQYLPVKSASDVEVPKIIISRKNFNFMPILNKFFRIFICLSPLEIILTNDKKAQQQPDRLW